MSIPVIAFCLLATPFFAPQLMSGSPKATVQIVGYVIDKNGHPVSGATIKYFAYSGFDGLMPEAQSDADGYFSLAIPALGEGLVRAMKFDSGYPDAANILYGRTGYDSLKEINANGSTPLIEVTLRFGEPDAVVDWTIRSAEDLSVLHKATYKIASVDDPQSLSSGTVGISGRFLFVLPKHPVAIVISAPGYKDWSTADDPPSARISC